MELGALLTPTHHLRHAVMQPCIKIDLTQNQIGSPPPTIVSTVHYCASRRHVDVGEKRRLISRGISNAVNVRCYAEGFVQTTDSDKNGRSHEWESVTNLLQRSGMLVSLSSPEDALREGRWVKLICGASFEDVADIRNLSLVYSLAGVDCIDCAADSAVVAAVLEGVTTAQLVARQLDAARSFQLRRPWIMVSINDDEDPHFRKAEFDSQFCPADCPRPCEWVCPASAIAFNRPARGLEIIPRAIAEPSNLDYHSELPMGGVITERCYGCGRCLPICPVGIIRARTYVRSLKTVADLLCSSDVDAIEIHTGVGHLDAFRKLVAGLANELLSLKLVAVSVPDLGKLMVPTLAAMYNCLQPSLTCLNLWQLDGRPMSGDIGAGATRAAVSLAAHVTASPDRPPGFIQLAGGTNAHTVDALKRAGLFQSTSLGKEAVIAGVAYGGYARKIVTNYLQKMEICQRQWEGSHSDLLQSASAPVGLEHYPSLLLGALQEAVSLIGPLKGF